MTASIVNIGDELLIGQVVNTNASWMAEELNKINVKVTRVTVVGDLGEDISKELSRATEETDIVLITGGLGPTKDDITKQVLAKHFGVGMVTHQETLDRVTGYFRKRGIPMPEVNKFQAQVLENCQVVVNEVGTAPCMVIEEKGKMVVSMPGVPFEMKWLMTNRILPMIEKMCQGGGIVHKTIGVFGIPESALAELISDWEDALPKCIRLAYLPKAGIVRLRLSAFGAERDELAKIVDKEVEGLRKLVGDSIFTECDESLSEAIGRRLSERGESVCTAESCTAGLVSHRIVETAGASGWMRGGIVAYSNDVKSSVLGVDKCLIERVGAVSEEVAREMAFGALRATGADWAISTTGISGPGGESDEKPVGLVYIAVAHGDKAWVEKFRYMTTREQHQERTANQALFNLYKFLR